MKKNKLILITSCILFGILWSLALIALAFFFSKSVETPLKDIFFMEGILAIIIGLFSSIGGNPMGVSMQSLGQINAQYVGSSNLEIKRLEKEKSIVKDTIKIGVSTVSLILGGAFTLIISLL